MAREKSPLREQAFKLWCEGGRTRKLASIARELGVKPELIRKWKHEGNWEERPDPGPRRRGAPKGNKNAIGNKGGGAPLKNQNAFKTGLYSTIWEDVLDPEEQAKLLFVETDPVRQVENHLRFLELRERRMLQLRARILEGWDASSISTKSEAFTEVVEGIGDIPQFDEEGFLKNGPRRETVMKETERTVKTSQKLERILAIENALTSIQDKKLKCIELLCKIEARELTAEETRARIERLNRENKILAAKEW
ncbi:phage terminase small subunit [Paenibacillus sp. HJGM_3]|uniref:phage terminase small subunit n=1 Tax=Paenibacillus sp. HJGM_3 TaxID=3379816 RepID=UPI00385FA042